MKNKCDGCVFKTVAVVCFRLYRNKSSIFEHIFNEIVYFALGSYTYMYYMILMVRIFLSNTFNFPFCITDLICSI